MWRFTGDRAWMAIGDRLQAPSYLSRVVHHWKIRARKQRRDIGKYCFVNRSITDWNQLPEWAIGTSHGKTRIFKTRVREGGEKRGGGGGGGEKKKKKKKKEKKKKKHPPPPPPPPPAS